MAARQTWTASECGPVCPHGVGTIKVNVKAFSLAALPVLQLARPLSVHNVRDLNWRKKVIQKTEKWCDRSTIAGVTDVAIYS